MKKAVIILDGLGDVRYKNLGNKTPFEYAKTPNLDYLAKNGVKGFMQPIKNVAPESGDSQFAILTGSLNNVPSRGILEAIDAGIKLKKGECALRCNFAKIKGDKIIKVRIDIPSKNELNKLNKIDKDIRIIPTIGYRGVIIVKNSKGRIENTHPGYKRYKNISMAIDPIMKLKSSKNKKMDNFLREVKKILKNKTLLLRGFGCNIPKIKKMSNWSLLADMPVEIGLGKVLGMKILDKKNEIKKIINAKSNIYVQIKGPDTYGHRGDLKGKIRAIEKIDRMLKPLTKLKNTLICITSDHATPCKLKRHSKDLVPLIIYNGVKKGKIKTIYGKDLMKILNRF